ncbi:unnamed protein product, partial [Darwinula stevensoni]
MEEKERRRKHAKNLEVAVFIQNVKQDLHRQVPSVGESSNSNGEIEVAVVSSTWMNPNEMEVAWPPCKTDRNLNGSLTLHHLPADDCQWCASHCILYATTSLAQAWKEAKLAEDISGVETGDEMKEKERRRKHAKNLEVALFIQKIKQDLHRQVPSVGESSTFQELIMRKLKEINQQIGKRILRFFWRNFENLTLHRVRSKHVWIKDGELWTCRFHSQEVCGCGKCKEDDDLSHCRRHIPYTSSMTLTCPLHLALYQIECLRHGDECDQYIHPELSKGHSYLPEAAHNGMLRNVQKMLEVRNSILESQNMEGKKKYRVMMKWAQVEENEEWKQWVKQQSFKHDYGQVEDDDEFPEEQHLEATVWLTIAVAKRAGAIVALATPPVTAGPKQAVSYLHGIGGKDGKETIIHMVKALIRKEVAQEYYFLGKKGKKCFKEIMICKSITGTQAGTIFGWFLMRLHPRSTLTFLFFHIKLYNLTRLQLQSRTPN